MTHVSESSIDQLLIGDSAPMRHVRALIRRIGPSSLPVLIEGPTGSGKELVARALHIASGRSGDFVAFNVCAVAESMFEDSLFGHVRGAFTGAVSDRTGYLLEAHEGTIFLDEISGLSIALQAKLLRAIETKEFRAVGSRTDCRSDFRLVSATNERLTDVADQGAFRHDLLYRLRGVVIEVPPLARRLEDVPRLAQYFAVNANTDSSRGSPRVLAADAIELLQGYDWPGNVRELKAVVECAAALGETAIISRVDVLRSGMFANDRRRNAVEETRRGFVERRLLEVLDETSWNVEAAAAILGVHRATIYRRLERIGSPSRRSNVMPAQESLSVQRPTSNRPRAS